MAGVGQTLDLLPQLQALFSDPLRVISYKWLSRNFSVSSNDAKRLLQEFASKHGNDLQVIYSVSGWLKNNPQNYRVKLASSLKLEEARQEFEDSCSVQIYSIQACIPRDTAVLWNPEFVQAEELFSQPFDEENCLRDNRFCGVSNSFVERTADRKHVSQLPPKPVNGMSAAAKSKPVSIQKDQLVPPCQQGLSGPTSSKQGLRSKTEKDTSSAPDKTNKPPSIKEPEEPIDAGNTKAQNAKASGNNGSLATMWGRASTKPKPPTSGSTDVQNIAATADAQIFAKEAADAASSDDEQGLNCKRDSTSASNRKRRVVFDFSDDDEEENVIALESPEPQKVRAPNPASTAAEIIIPKEKNLDKKEEIASNLRDSTKGRNSGFSSECDIKNGSNSNTSGITLKEKANVPHANGNKQDHAADSASTSPKRRKVLKTRIDERGREVTEVVWEGEAPASDKTAISADAMSSVRTTLPKKPQPSTISERANVTSKATGNKKPAKGGTKDNKQGNILSFFKKI